MKLGIVIFPTKELQDVANSYRKRYDPRYKLISPHLTLKEAFTAEKDEVESIAKELEDIAKQSPAFSLHFHKISHFHPTNNVIYFACEDEPKLYELHDNIHNRDVLQHEKQYSFVPHVTIGQEMPDDELHDIYSRLRMERYDYHVPVHQFHLVHQLENDTWSIYQSYTLGE
ncbi:2'-5' RNA ligase family protein [Caldalkalibacillus salinus]|uniref:2'-5' RNA ligase family protein n=1 Tax=Caldalkalibacillus salinus TaxID=2803787 RepID=UPI00192138BD